MYQFLSDLSRFISQPFLNLLSLTKEIPFIFSFLLGLVGALAPCQLTGNIGAITYYGNRSLQSPNQWANIIFFVFGKITVFSLLGLAVWLVGQNLQENLPDVFSIARKLLGPFLVMIGLTLVGFIKLNWINRIFALIPQRILTGNMGSFLMGVSFSIAFCPTMFTIFFLTFMPIVLSSSYGVVLPSVFAIGTSVPVLLFAGIISYFGLNGSLMKKSKKFGFYIQFSTGILIILIGFFDTLTYWL